MLRPHNSAMQRLCTANWSELHFAVSRSESRLPLSLSLAGQRVTMLQPHSHCTAHLSGLHAPVSDPGGSL